jgi:hypothetical protein
MSQENVDLFHLAVAAMNHHDREAFMDLMDDRVEAVPRIAAMEGNYHGHEGIRRWWEGLYGVFPDLTTEVAEVRDLGKLTFAALHLRGRGVGSATPIDEAVWHLARWQGGKCTRWGIYGTEDEALEAVGLSERG